MESRAVKIYAPDNNNISLKIIPGHFATSYSHINYYIDMTSIKTRQKDAEEAAKVLAGNYISNVIVDTIVCMDGCEVIGGFLAAQLSSTGIMNQNAHKTIYVISPEFNTNGQMMVPENNQAAVRGKHILLLVASATTGNTVRKSLECIQYYGGKIQGVSAIFSAVSQVDGVMVNSIFHDQDIPDYHNYHISECPFCKNGQKIEAIVNGYGYTRL